MTGSILNMNYLQNCAWAKNPYGGRFAGYRQRPDSAYYELMGILNKPTLEFNDRDDDDRDIILTVNTQGFNLKQAELELKLEYQADNVSGVLNLSAAAKSGKVRTTGVKPVGKGITPSTFWYYAKVTLLREPLAGAIVNGIKINITRQMFAELKGLGEIDLKASCRVWPLGKNKTISSHSGLQYSLPAPEFDSDGVPKRVKQKTDSGQVIEVQPLEIAEAEIDLKRSDTVLPGPIRADDMDVSPTMA